jgi:hypothetical protein
LGVIKKTRLDIRWQRELSRQPRQRLPLLTIRVARCRFAFHRYAVPAVPALIPALLPLPIDGSRSTCMLFHPRIEGGIPL